MTSKEVGRYFNEETSTNKGIAIQLLFPSKPLATGFSAGYTSTDFSGVVTKTDGREILEIDHAPAKQKYLAWIGQVAQQTIPDHFKFQVVTRFPLGRLVGTNLCATLLQAFSSNRSHN